MKVKSLVKEFIARVTGDDVAATAQKFYRQADSALNTQIFSLKGKTVTLEIQIENAKERLAKARTNNGVLINDDESEMYVANLIAAQNGITDAEEKLELHLKKIKFLEAELEANKVDVEE